MQPDQCLVMITHAAPSVLSVDTHAAPPILIDDHTCQCLFMMTHIASPVLIYDDIYCLICAYL